MGLVVAGGKAEDVGVLVDFEVLVKAWVGEDVMSWERY